MILRKCVGVDSCNWEKNNLKPILTISLKY